MEHNPITGERGPAREPGFGTAIFCLLFGAYLLVGAVVTYTSGKWPIFLPPQLDLVGLLLGAFGPIGVYVSATIVLLIGLLCLWVAIAVIRRLIA